MKTRLLVSLSLFFGGSISSVAAASNEVASLLRQQRWLQVTTNSSAPTTTPSESPTIAPSVTPTVSPSATPTATPSGAPSSAGPSSAPTTTVGPLSPNEDDTILSVGAKTAIVIAALLFVAALAYMLLEGQRKKIERELLQAPPPSVAADSSQSATQYDDKKHRMVILAPAGMLGIRVETTAQGALVMAVSKDSPLVDKISVGDIIDKVNELSLVGMDATQVDQILGSDKKWPRQLSVIQVADQ